MSEKHPEVLSPVSLLEQLTSDPSQIANLDLATIRRLQEMLAGNAREREETARKAFDRLIAEAVESVYSRPEYADYPTEDFLVRWTATEGEAADADGNATVTLTAHVVRSYKLAKTRTTTTAATATTAAVGRMRKPFRVYPAADMDALRAAYPSLHAMVVGADGDESRLPTFSGVGVFQSWSGRAYGTVKRHRDSGLLQFRELGEGEYKHIV